MMGQVFTSYGWREVPYQFFFGGEVSIWGGLYGLNVPGFDFKCASGL